MGQSANERREEMAFRYCSHLTRAAAMHEINVKEFSFFSEYPSQSPSRENMATHLSKVQLN